MMLFANCGGSSGSSNSAVSGYYTVTGTGQCYQSGTQTAVAASNCQGTGYYTYQNNICYNTSGANVGMQYCQGTATTGSYTVINGVCMQNGTTQVQSSYCQNPTGYNNGFSNSGYSNTGNGYGGENSCVGSYYVAVYGTYEPIVCNGSNCSGLVVYSGNGQATRCQ